MRDPLFVAAVAFGAAAVFSALGRQLTAFSRGEKSYLQLVQGKPLAKFLAATVIAIFASTLIVAITGKPIVWVVYLAVVLLACGFAFSIVAKYRGNQPHR